MLRRILAYAQKIVQLIDQLDGIHDGRKQPQIPAWRVFRSVLVMLLVRLPHRSVNTNLLHQAVAMAAFCSGVFFMGQASTGGRRRGRSRRASSWRRTCSG